MFTPKRAGCEPIWTQVHNENEKCICPYRYKTGKKYTKMLSKCSCFESGIVGNFASLTDGLSSKFSTEGIRTGNMVPGGTCALEPVPSSATYCRVMSQGLSVPANWLRGWLWGLNEMMYIRCPLRWPTEQKSVSLMYYFYRQKEFFSSLWQRLLSVQSLRFIG